MKKISHLRSLPRIVTLVIGCATCIQVSATLTIDYPMQFDSQGIVGIAEGFSGDNPGTDASRLAQNILTFLTPTTSSYADPEAYDEQKQVWIYRHYQDSPSKDYSGIINGLGIKTDTPNSGNTVTLTKPGGSVYVPSGYEFVIAKYDGQNAGWVLFALDGQDAYLPAISQSFWGLESGQYAMSSFTVFNPIHDPPAVPEPSTIIAGALMLVPIFASTWRTFRKYRSR